MKCKAPGWENMDVSPGYRPLAPETVRRELRKAGFEDAGEQPPHGVSMMVNPTRPGARIFVHGERGSLTFKDARLPNPNQGGRYLGSFHVNGHFCWPGSVAELHAIIRDLYAVYPALCGTTLTPWLKMQPINPGDPQ